MKFLMGGDKGYPSNHYPVAFPWDRHKECIKGYAACHEVVWGLMTSQVTAVVMLHTVASAIDNHQHMLCSV